MNPYPPHHLTLTLIRVPQVELSQVRDQEPLRTYIEGWLVLTGDAAHPMVLYQGRAPRGCRKPQCALCECLRPRGIPDRLRV